MEKLHYSRHLHAHYDSRILSNHLWRTAGTDDNGNMVNCFPRFDDDDQFSRWFLAFADSAGAGEMFRRDYFDWISSVSHPWFAVVP